MFIRGTAQFECLGDKVRDERMKGSGPIQRKDSGYIRQTVLNVSQEKKKTTDRVHGCSEGCHAEDYCDKGGCWGEGEKESDDLLVTP